MSRWRSDLHECRALAALTLAQVLQGQSLNHVLPPALAQVRPADRSLLHSLCYETLRWYRPLEAMLTQLLHQPLSQRDRLLHALLLVGLCQIFKLRIPDHAAVATTVNATALLRLPQARKRVNAVLRQALRRQHPLQQAIAADPRIASAHLDWLYQALQQAWPKQAAQMIAANNAHPAMTLRVNLNRLSRETYLQQLAAESITAHAHPHVATAITLDHPCAVDTLPGFMQGTVSVQDAGAQLAVPLLDPQAGQRVLDACAAPGGKTGHLLEYASELEVWAVDHDPQRLQRVPENLKRLNLSAHLVSADATQPEHWWDGHPFQAILLDAPCSGTGVIVRHPDIKLLRRASDIAALAQRQTQLLEALWPLLAPGGSLLYTACSVLPEETQAVVTDFCQRHQHASILPIDISWGWKAGLGWQSLPGYAQTDGFFYARLRK